MQQTLRPYLTAGVALVGAGMIAVTPVAAPPSMDIQQMRDVALTAGAGDIFSGLTDALKETATNAQASFSDLGTAFKDLVGAFSDPKEALSNLQTALAAISFAHGDQKSFLIGGEDLPTGAAALSNDDFHTILFAILTNPTGIPGGDGSPVLPESAVPLVNFLSSPLSGVLIGDVSPLLAPFAALDDSVTRIIADLTGNGAHQSVIHALENVVKIPGHMLDALFNGGTLNLDALVPAIEKAGVLPEGFSINGLSYTFGGLFNPGETITGPGSDLSSVPQLTGAGGSILNGLGIDTILNIEGQGVGPIGGLAGLIGAIATALDGKLPPLEPPTTAPNGSEALDPGLFSHFLDSHGLDQLGSDFASIGL